MVSIAELIRETYTSGKGSPCRNCPDRKRDFTCLDNGCRRPADYADSLGNPVIGSVPVCESDYGRKLSKAMPAYPRASPGTWYVSKCQSNGQGRRIKDSTRPFCRWPHGCPNRCGKDNEHGLCGNHVSIINHRVAAGDDGERLWRAVDTHSPRPKRSGN